MQRIEAGSGADLVMVMEWFIDDETEPSEVARSPQSDSGWRSAAEAVASWKSRGWKFTPYRNGIEYIDDGSAHGFRRRTRVWFEDAGAPECLSEPDISTFEVPIAAPGDMVLF